MITIKLFGRSYTFKTESDVNKANEVADILVSEVEKIQEKASGQAPEMTKFTILMLVALNMASEIYELKQNQSHFRSKLNEKSNRLSKLLEEGFSQIE